MPLIFINLNIFFKRTYECLWNCSNIVAFREWTISKPGNTEKQIIAKPRNHSLNCKKNENQNLAFIFSEHLMFSKGRWNKSRQLIRSQKLKQTNHQMQNSYKMFLNWFELFTSWYVDVGGDPKIDLAMLLVNQSMSAKLKHLNVIKYKYYEKLCNIHMAMT